MKINAVIESRDGGTLVLDFPRSIYDVYEKLQSVGIRKSPHQITMIQMFRILGSLSRGLYERSAVPQDSVLHTPFRTCFGQAACC